MDQEPTSRSELRRQQRRPKQHSTSDHGPATPYADQVRLTREESLRLTKEKLANERSERLKHRLNWVILGLVVAIIIVYLILFFVG